MPVKVSELRPCDSCKGKIAPIFYRIRFDLAMIDPNAVNEFFGMHTFFQGRASPALVENFAPHSHDAVTFAGDKEPSLLWEVWICNECFSMGKIDLPMLMESIIQRRKDAGASDDAALEITDGVSGAAAMAPEDET